MRRVGVVNRGSAGCPSTPSADQPGGIQKVVVTPTAAAWYGLGTLGIVGALVHAHRNDFYSERGRSLVMITKTGGACRVLAWAVFGAAVLGFFFASVDIRCLLQPFLRDARQKEVARRLRLAGSHAGAKRPA
jgi:hypothetical protein